MADSESAGDPIGERAGVLHHEAVYRYVARIGEAVDGALRGHAHRARDAVLEHDDALILRGRNGAFEVGFGFEG